MSQFIAANFVPLLFGGLLVFLLTGFPVAFSLAATGLFFGWIGMEVGLFPVTLFQALPLRVQGVMQNETLLAVPFFTLMGIILEKSGMAEDLLETVGDQDCHSLALKRIRVHGWILIGLSELNRWTAPGWRRDVS